MRSSDLFEIPKKLIQNAYEKVKAKNSGPGIDGVTVKEYGSNLEKNISTLWFHLSNGSYFPKPVKLVEIPKPNGEKRTLGIPTVEDRIAQSVVNAVLTDKLDNIFHTDSYGYRPHKSALEAVSVAAKRCLRYNWALKVDISKFFDTINHKLLLSILVQYIGKHWMYVFIERWLKAPYQTKGGDIIEHNQGVPQGSVVGPVLANLFLHHTFDAWMADEFPTIPFERYADDILCHTVSRKQASFLKWQLRERLWYCHLSINEEKTKMVYCQDSCRKEPFECVTFDFLGFTFKSKSVGCCRQGRLAFEVFKPTISKQSLEGIRDAIIHVGLWRNTGIGVPDIARVLNPIVNGWIGYYSKFSKYELKRVFSLINKKLSIWLRQKNQSIGSIKEASMILYDIFESNPDLFSHWTYGSFPYA